MRLKRLGIIFAFMLVLLSVSPARADLTTAGDISKELTCQCGCNMVLSNCSHAECASREAMTATIKQKLAEGKSKTEIIQSFVQQYGEKVLAAPTKKGFNLTAWLSPLAALLVGGGVIYLALRAWVRRGKRFQASAITEAKEGDEEYRRRLEEELKEFTARGFR